jgi:hypothetical protein
MLICPQNRRQGQDAGDNIEKRVNMNRSLASIAFRLVVLVCIASAIFAHRSQLSAGYYKARVSAGKFFAICREFLNSIRFMPAAGQAIIGRDEWESVIAGDEKIPPEREEGTPELQGYRAPAYKAPTVNRGRN